MSSCASFQFFCSLELLRECRDECGSGRMTCQTYFLVPRFTYMSTWCPGDVLMPFLNHFKFTTKLPPAFRHPFQLITLLMLSISIVVRLVSVRAGWVALMNQCCSGQICGLVLAWCCFDVPGKPHPMGNEYHTICCGVSGSSMCTIEPVQGKDWPSQIPDENNSKHGKTSGLLLRLTESIHHSGRVGRVVIMDSGFCVFLALMKLASFCVYLSAVIKKRRYWPK